MSGQCPKHGYYHEEAHEGCGVAVFVGSSFAEHCLHCPKSPMYGEHRGFFNPNDGNKYPAWEAPAGNCPGCWHETNPHSERTEFSGAGHDHTFNKRNTN